MIDSAFFGFYVPAMAFNLLPGLLIVTATSTNNYATGGIRSEIIANRLGVGPMKDCTECLYEEFYHSAWTVGDPAQHADELRRLGRAGCHPWWRRRWPRRPRQRPRPRRGGGR